MKMLSGLTIMYVRIVDLFLKKLNFHIFSNSNIYDIYNKLNNFNYTFSKYKIFIIKDPKYRVIMSDTIYDKNSYLYNCI